MRAIMRGMVNPSLAEWLQGWGTVAGSIFAAVAAVTALALYWRETANRRKDLGDLFTRQARNVLVTVDTPSRPAQLSEVKVVAHNFTDEVIVSLYIRVHRLDTGVEVTWMSSDVFEPKSTWSRDVKLEPIMVCDRPEHPPEMFEFNYWFTDARGRHWHRVDRQLPERIENHPSLEWASYRFHRR
jgi:hypothetical protein